MSAVTLTNWAVIVAIVGLLIVRIRPKYSLWIAFTQRWIIGGVLFAAGAIKARNAAEARMAVQAYRILPARIAALLGYSLPWLEMAVGIVLIIGVTVRGASLISATLMAIFILAIAQAWARGLSIDCGCFGGGGKVAAGETKYLQEIARDLGLLATASYLARHPRSKFSVE